MLAILAQDRDAQARALVERWTAADARLLTVRDLSAPGWQHHVGTQGSEYAVLGGVRVEVSAIRGVVTRLPCILESDLSHIAPADRRYVSVEMTAFLKSWLSRLPCPVLNRPSASSLLGPVRSQERWMALASACGLRLAERVRTPGRDRPLPVAFSVVVVGRQSFGPVADILGRQAVALAARAGVELLTVSFDGPGEDAAFLSADLLIDPTAPAVADALLERLHKGERT